MTLTPVKKTVHRVWTSARLLIGFHRKPDGAMRDKAYVWAPKDGHATIREDVTDAEVFCELASANGDKDMNVQIKLHPDKIVLRRGTPDYWKGIVVSEFDVQVQVGGIWVKIGYDGTVTRQTDVDTTLVEVDGSVFKETLYSTAKMSADGTELSSVGPDQVASVSLDGIMLVKKSDE